MDDTLRTLRHASRYFKWIDGKFDPSTYYVLDGSEELFTYRVLRTTLVKSIPLAGREFSLGVVKDLRQSGGLRPEIAEALLLHAERPGVKAFAKRLSSAGAGEIDALEREIREAQ